MGSVQTEEWLVYFFEAQHYHRYSKWLWWWKPKKGFTHCGTLRYILDTDQWIHLQFTHAGIRMEILNAEEASEYSLGLPEFGCILINTDFGILQESSFSGGNCVEGTCADEDDLDVILHEGHDEKLKELAKILT